MVEVVEEERRNGSRAVEDKRVVSGGGEGSPSLRKRTQDEEVILCFLVSVKDGEPVRQVERKLS